MLDNSVCLIAQYDPAEIIVDDAHGIPANRILILARANGRTESVHLYLSHTQLRDLHAKIGARLAEIDAQQPVVDIEGEIECPF